MDLRTLISIAALSTGACAAIAPHLGSDARWVSTPHDSADPACVTGGDGAEQVKCDGGRRALIVARARDGLFRVPMTVNGVQVSAILDTGAHDLILSRAQARALGVRFLPGRGVTVRTAGGVSAMRWALADRIEVGGHDLRALRVGVLSGDLPAPLLGLDAITRLNEVRISQGKLHIAPPAR